MNCVASITHVSRADGLHTLQTTFCDSSLRMLVLRVTYATGREVFRHSIVIYTRQERQTERERARCVVAGVG